MSNYSENKKAIDQFRKDLKAMFDDIRDIDIKVLNKAVNEGVEVAKENTNASKGGNVVEFYTRDGKHVKFTIAKALVGKKMKEAWRALPAVKSKAGVTKIMVNLEDYSSFVNYGHVIRNKKGGPVKGFVKGQYMLEKAISKAENTMVKEFKKEVERVNRKHDK